MISADIDRHMDGLYTLVVVIPPRFEADVRKGRDIEVPGQRRRHRSPAGVLGSGYIQNMVTDEVTRYRQQMQRTAFVRSRHPPRVQSNGTQSWFRAVVGLADQLSMLIIILTGAALLREREHGTIEHLLVMPLTAFEIALAKVWSSGLVIMIGFISFSWSGRPRRADCRLARVLLLGTPSTSSPRRRSRSSSAPRPHHGAICPADDDGRDADDDAVGRHVAHREPAAMGPVRDVVFPVAALCGLHAGDRVSRQGLDIVWKEFVTVLVMGVTFLVMSLLPFRQSLRPSVRHFCDRRFSPWTIVHDKPSCVHLPTSSQSAANSHLFAPLAH
jgi:ABC-2 type transport system permease protein